MKNTWQGLLLFLFVFGLPAIVVALVADGWAPWVVYGFLCLTVFGTGLAVRNPRPTLKKRTFVRHYRDDR